MKKSITFARVSSREQEDTGYSLPSQEKLLAGYSQSKGFRVCKKFAISESASGRYQRRTFDEMLQYVNKNNIKIIVCEKVDRLTRNLKDAVAINEWINKDAEREVHFVKETCVLNKESRSNEKFIWNIKVSVAQYYIDNLSEEVKKGQKEKLEQGWYPSHPKLGYKTEGEKGHKIHVINHEVAPLVKKMFELYASGTYSLSKLVEEMFKLGLRTRKGNKLVKSRMASILAEPFYIGKMRWNNIIHQGNHETFITKELFDRVQANLKGKTSPRYHKHSFLFKGLIRCEECTGTITWETQKSFIYGHCNHYRPCSQKVWAKEPEVEEQLVDYFGQLEVKSKRMVDWIRKALKESHKDEIRFHESTIGELNKRHEQLQKRLDRLYDDKLDGIIDSDFYKRRFELYSEEKAEVVEQIKRHSQSNTKYLDLGMNIFDLSQRAREIYIESEPDKKRRLLKLVFTDMKLNEGILSTNFSPAFQLLADAVTATNSSKGLKLSKTSRKIFEREEFRQDQNKTTSHSTDRFIWLRGWDSNPRPIG